MNKETTTVRVPKELWDKLCKIAKLNQRSATAEVRVALRHYIAISPEVEEREPCN